MRRTKSKSARRFKTVPVQEALAVAAMSKPPVERVPTKREPYAIQVKSAAERMPATNPARG